MEVFNMKWIKHIALTLVLIIGASSQAAFNLPGIFNKLPANAVQQSANPVPIQSASYLTKSWESLNKWWKNYKFEIKPYSLIDLIRAYPVTSFCTGIFASYGLFKLYVYTYYDFPNKVSKIREAINEELHIIGSNPKEHFLLQETHCCNCIEFLFCQKWKASLAEVVGGSKLVELIKEFYAAKKNWHGTSPITVGTAFEYSKKINRYLDYNRFVD
jgi:hypothetical protein